jgi:predicted ester cyclase
VLAAHEAIPLLSPGSALDIALIDRPPRRMHPTADEIARRYYELFNARLLDQSERLVAPDALFHYPSFTHGLVGKAAHRALSQIWLTAFPDLQLEILHVRRNGPAFVVVHSLARGTHKGPLQLGELHVQPTGRHMVIEFQHAFKGAQGRIIDVTLELDMRELVRQLTQP